MTHETQKAPRKPYAAPQLLIYGDIREITKSGTEGPIDNNGKGVGMNTSGV
jgi:hypothetical protein